MSSESCALPEALPPQAAPLTLVGALLGLCLGGAAVAVGVATEAPALWGFGGACLVQGPLAWVVAGRLRSGLGNRGLDTELRVLRITLNLLRLLALGLALAAFLTHPAALPEGPQALVFASLLALALLWWAQHRLAPAHAALAAQAQRTRTLAELAGLLTLGTLAARWLPWADPAAALLIAARLLLAAHAMGKAFAVKVSCGGCSCG